MKQLGDMIQFGGRLRAALFISLKIIVRMGAAALMQARS
jgi:hypothetical protein